MPKVPDDKVKFRHKKLEKRDPIWITCFRPEPIAPTEIGGLKRMLMRLVSDRSGHVTCTAGIDYMVHPSGTVQRLTRKQDKAKARKVKKNEA